MNKKELSIIIVTYNSSSIIMDCLGSIFTHNDIDDRLEVIIVDNNSTDPEAMFQQIRETYGNNVILIKNNSNSGYGAGNNIGIKACSAPFFVVMNPDVNVISPIFKHLINIFTQKPKTGMIGVNFTKGNLPFQLRPEHKTPFNILRYLFWKNRSVFKENLMFVSGCFTAFNKEDFFKAGMYDENIFMYYEESDIANRMLSIDKEIYWAKEIYLHHPIHERQFNPHLAKIEEASLNYYMEKYKIVPYKLYKVFLLEQRLVYMKSLFIGDRNYRHKCKMNIRNIKARKELTKLLQ